MDMLITLLVWFLVLALAYWAVHRIAAGFALPAPVVTVIDVLLVVVAIVVLLRVSGLTARL